MKASKEIWGDIDGFSMFYQVSSFGRVRSLTRRVNQKQNKGYILNGKIKAPSIRKDRRVVVNLLKNSKQYPRYAHRLVGKAFIPNPNNKPCINHIDGNPTNNHVDNLEWCTHSENQYHAFANSLMPQGEDHHKAKCTNDDIVEIRRMRKEDNLTYPEIASAYRLSIMTISNIITNKSWKHV